jgi:hypothetical protein
MGHGLRSPDRQRCESLRSARGGSRLAIGGGSRLAISRSATVRSPDRLGVAGGGCRESRKRAESESELSRGRRTRVLENGLRKNFP